MLERYHDAMVSAVRSVGEMVVVLFLKVLMMLLLFRSSEGGVAGMSRTWSELVLLLLDAGSNSLGLLILRVVHVCASTIANGVL